MSSVATVSCTICFDALPNSEKPVSRKEISFKGENKLDKNSMTCIATKCDHLFHEKCLSGWIKEFETKTEKASCPLCRTTLIDTPGVVLPELPELPMPHELMLVLLLSESIGPPTGASPAMTSNVDLFNAVRRLHLINLIVNRAVSGEGPSMHTLFSHQSSENNNDSHLNDEDLNSSDSD